MSFSSSPPLSTIIHQISSNNGVIISILLQWRASAINVWWIKSVAWHGGVSSLSGDRQFGRHVVTCFISFSFSVWPSYSLSGVMIGMTMAHGRACPGVTRHGSSPSHWTFSQVSVCIPGETNAAFSLAKLVFCIFGMLSSYVFFSACLCYL